MKWNDNPENLIRLFKNNVGKRISKIDAVEYNKLLQVIRVCIKNEVGEVLSIYNSENALVASGFFLKHKRRITLLVSSSKGNYEIKFFRNIFRKLFPTVSNSVIHSVQQEFGIRFRSKMSGT